MKNSFTSSIPASSKKYQNQTSSNKISDDEFRDICKPYEFTVKKIIYQIFCSIIFFLPLRVLFCFVTLTFACTVIVCVRLIVKTFQLAINTGHQFCLSVARFGIRCVLYSFGIVFIKKDGRFDETARFYISNHVCILDPFIILIYHEFSYIFSDSSLEIQSNQFLQFLLEVIHPIYTNSSHETTNFKTINKVADDFIQPPVLVFPEGMNNLGCGEVLMPFNHIPFSTPYKVQPITIMYRMFGVPQSWNSYAYKGESVLSYLWRLFSMPPSLVAMHLLSPITLETDGKACIDRFVENSHLIMANHIGIKAVSGVQAVGANDGTD